MGQITYRGNLSARAFPLIAEQFGRTVIVGGQDQNFNRQIQSEADIDKDRGIPQVYYCHNVMPTAEGLQSIGYTDRIAAADDPVVDNFVAIYTSQNVDFQPVLIAHTRDGRNFELNVFNQWVEVNTIPGTTPFTVITTAIVGGQTYFCFSGLGVYYFDQVTHLFVKVTLIGVSDADVRGITSSSGYLIAWTKNYVGWSSALAHLIVSDPFDFTPSLVTGAGGGQVEDAKGLINICVPHQMGFIMYCNQNAVGAVYTNNARFPFNFKEIPGAGGLIDIALISTESNSTNHYAYTTAGLQSVTMTSGVPVMSEVSDFLSGKYFEDFDDNTNTFSHVALTVPMNKAINVVVDRYVVISYGRFFNGTVTKFTHALVYDLGQKRFGKLKIDHEDVYNYGFASLSDANFSDSIRESVGFFHRTGMVKTVNFEVTDDTANGTLVLGKYQYVRSRLLTLDGIELENIFPTSTFSVSNLLSLDGKNTSLRAVTAIDPVGNLRTYAVRQTGINHSLLIKGSFYLSSILLKFHISGRR